ncbi:Lrp/AsnC family transcriptional regulator [Aquimarina sediminis]|uniref:Lrp/AsnC family transcriptional regulator n=1 Tax=Aquimarina sediminis TaxID=2070536 RepID=UPI001F4D397E|nr:Lrp/AsnC family transcriptional regulator [Aquimarina sediminis]
MSNESMIDDLDRNIIVNLQKNSRISFADLGRRINLSPSAVRERIQKMEDAGVIKNYDIKLDYKALGYTIEAFVLVKVFHGNLKALFSLINKLVEVKEAYRITGNQNVHLKVVLKDQLHLQNLIDQLMQYGDTTTFLILSDITPIE